MCKIKKMISMYLSDKKKPACLPVIDNITDRLHNHVTFLF